MVFSGLTVWIHYSLQEHLIAHITKTRRLQTVLSWDDARLIHSRARAWTTWKLIRNHFWLSHFSSLTFVTSLRHFFHFCLLSDVLCILSLLEKSSTGPEIKSELFLSLRTSKKFSVFLSLVNVFFFISVCICIFYCIFHACYNSM